MLTNKDFSHINSLKDLKAAKRGAVKDIEIAENRLEHLLTELPMKAIGNTVGFVAAAVAKGFYSSNDKNASYSSHSSGTENNEPMNFGQTLQSVGEETAMFALSKLIEKLVANR